VAVPQPSLLLLLLNLLLCRSLEVMTSTDELGERWLLNMLCRAWCLPPLYADGLELSLDAMEGERGW